jgi:hypothetical protein
MTPEQIEHLERERRVETFPRSARPRCGAKTKAGTACQAQALKNGRCPLHGGLSTGPNTPGGKAKRAEIARAHMSKMWDRWRVEGRNQNLTEEGRRRIGEAQKRRWARQEGKA